MTEIETGEGKLCLAGVHDAFSRRALGHAMGPQHDTSLVSTAPQASPLVDDLVRALGAASGI